MSCNKHEFESEEYKEPSNMKYKTIYKVMYYLFYLLLAISVGLSWHSIISFNLVGFFAFSILATFCYWNTEKIKQLIKTK